MKNYFTQEELLILLEALTCFESENIYDKHFEEKINNLYGKVMNIHECMEEGKERE